MSQASMIRKITAKTVAGNLKALVLEGLKEKQLKDGDFIDVFSVVGIIKKVNEGEHDQYGTYHEFGGTFESIVHFGPNAGKSFRAAKCFLPEVATDLLVDEYNRLAKENDGVSPEIQVAVKVIAQVDESSNTNYTFQVTPLMQAQEADPLEMLKKQANLAPALENKKQPEQQAAAKK